MAPTLNSTLILSEDNSTSTEKESSMDSKELSQYSPILARSRKAPSSPYPAHSKNAFKSTFTSLDCASNSHTNSNETSSLPLQEEINEIPIWICGEPRFVSGITSQTTCNNIIEALIEDELQALDTNNCDSALSHNLQDYVITERWRDVEQPLPGNTFILSLWKAWGTKCATNEVKFKLRVNKWSSKGSHLEVTTKKAATASHQKQQGSDHPVGGSAKVEEEDDTQVLPQKQKHDRKSERMTTINKMMRKILKQGETIKSHLSQLTDNQAEVQRIEKLCKNIRQIKKGKTILMEQFINSTILKMDQEVDPLLMPGTLSSALTSEDELFYMDHPILTDNDEAEQGKKKDCPRSGKAEMDDDDDDELFLVIEGNDDLDSGVHFDLNKRPKSRLTEMQPICSSIEMTEVLLETPKRKKRIQRNFEELRRHSLTHQFTATDKNEEPASNTTPSLVTDNPDFKRTSLQFDTIRREIIVKMNDLKDLLQREEDLIGNLETKCQKYKRENENYGRKQGVHLKVDDIQDNLNKYAKEIVQHELDLYKTKLEIRENYLVLDDLKEMLAAKDPISGFGKSEFNRLVEKKFGLSAVENGSCRPGNATPKQTEGGGGFCLPTFITSPFVDNIHEFCDNNNESIIV